MCCHSNWNRWWLWVLLLFSKEWIFFCWNFLIWIDWIRQHKASYRTSLNKRQLAGREFFLYYCDSVDWIKQNEGYRWQRVPQLLLADSHHQTFPVGQMKCQAIECLWTPRSQFICFNIIYTTYRFMLRRPIAIQNHIKIDDNLRCQPRQLHKIMMFQKLTFCLSSRHRVLPQNCYICIINI